MGVCSFSLAFLHHVTELVIVDLTISIVVDLVYIFC
jgi:hypothetical protein